MGKKATMLKAVAAGLLALVFVLATPAGGTQAEAAQFSGNEFGVGFAGEEYATMHKADGWSNGGMFNCTWRAANIWFDGYLNIKIDRDTNGGYSAGEYRTNDTFGYGMYDVSMKAIKNDGVVTSFFTYTGPSDGTPWDEIDIEILGKDTTKVQFNYYTNGQGGHEYMHNLGFDASQSFHQYGFLWQPGKITWYVDGKAVHTATSNIPTTPGKIMMNAWNGIGVDEWLKPYNGATPLVAQYDWINWKKVDNGSTSSGSTSSGSSSSGSTSSGTTAGTTNVPTVGTSFTIEAENYNYMSGVEAAGGCVGYIDPGDWMSYDINVQTAGTYNVAFYVASANGSSFRLEKNSGTEVLANVTVPNTGGWSNYQTVTKSVYLSAGKNTLGIATDQGAFNIDKMVFTMGGSSSNNNTSSNNNNNNWNNNTSGNNNNNTSSGSFNSTTPYKLINRNSGKALDIAWGSSDNGANILQYTYNGYNNQKWYLEPTGDGYYVIKSVATGKVVDVSGKSTANGGDVIQWQSNGGWNQQWKIVAVDGGYYKLINRHSGKAIDVNGRSTADNADVIQWDDNGGWNQHWKIEAAW